MLDEIGKFILEDVLGDSCAGLFLCARSLKARRLKAAGWICVFASIALLVAAALWPNAINPAVSVVIGLLMAAAGLGFGFGAKFVNTYTNNDSPDV